MNRSGGVSRYIDILKRDDDKFVQHMDRIVKLEPKEVNNKVDQKLVIEFTGVTPHPELDKPIDITPIDITSYDIEDGSEEQEDVTDCD